MTPAIPRRAVLALAGAAAVLVLAWGILVTRGPDPVLRSVVVGSHWNQAPLLCATTVIRVGGRDFEAFRCRPTSGELPEPGHYTQANTTWYSDVDRRPARRHDITVTRKGTVLGVAEY